MPIMTEGAEEAEAISEEIKAEASKRYRIRQHVFKVGEEYLIRLVTDRITRPLVAGGGTMPAWITASTHGFIPTKDKPEEYTGSKWPEKMWAVCQRDRMFQLRDPQDPSRLLDEYEDGYGDCYIHNTYSGVKEGQFQRDLGRPDAQVYALAVLREPVFDGTGKSVIAFRDQTAEWTDEKGNVLTVPKFVIISQKWVNFFAPIAAACYLPPKTATDKEFLVKRPDSKTYTIVPANQDPSFMFGTAEWGQQYEAPLAMMGFDLRDHLISHSTPDHYARWFIPGAMPKDGYARKEATPEEDSGGASAGAAPASPAIDQEAMASFRESPQGRGSK